jgi:hypothetical protein
MERWRTVRGTSWALGWRNWVLVATMCLAGTHAAADSGQPDAARAPHLWQGTPLDFASYQWQPTLTRAPWAARAGLQVVELDDTLYLMGGRTPLDPTIVPVPGASRIWSDVWKSRDLGASWENVLASDDPGHWPARAYFQALTHRGQMYVLGGQNFKLVRNPGCAFLPPPCTLAQVPQSDFFNDVWSSRDGRNWRQRTAKAPWAGRAGLSAVSFKGEIYVMAGSVNDDSAVVGGPPLRVYFNDVWKSRDGEHWVQVTARAPWAPRAGGVMLVKDGYLWMIGGEDGFLCEPTRPERCPPYFNDVWKSRDGANWEQVQRVVPGWSARPGHQVLVVYDHFVLFGGFGISPDPANPFRPSNPMDIWVSRDGAHWRLVSTTPWNARSPADIKYDFKALTVATGKVNLRQQVLTFGGDRETFDFADPLNWLRVDNDVWRYAWPHLPAR